ncbi:MAG: hypothetical protein SVE93_06555 [Candidatus Thermoplasmatota archaeon]|nr:hypothetical protein [Candidatus Thermoplasmatota archaeon]
MDDDISPGIVYSLVYLLAFFIPLSNASLEAKVSFGFWTLLVGVVIALFISSGLGETISEGGINIIVGGILGYTTGAIVQVLFPLVPSPFNWIISLIPLVPLLTLVWR